MLRSRRSSGQSRLSTVCRGTRCGHWGGSAGITAATADRVRRLERISRAATRTARHTQTVSNLGLMAVALGGRRPGARARPPRGRADRRGRGACSGSRACRGAAVRPPGPGTSRCSGARCRSRRSPTSGTCCSCRWPPPRCSPSRASRRRLSSRIRTVLDGLLIASALLFMSWMLVLGPLFDAGGDPLTLTIGLAYPLGDVVIITILLFASSHRSQRASSSGASRPLLFAGLLAFAVADSGFVYLTNSGSYSSGSLIDIGWFCAFAAIFLAGTVRADDAEPQSPDDDVPDRFAVLVPYVPVVLAVLLGAFGLAFGDGLGRFLGWNALALLMLAVIRQVAALLENLSLTTHLELRVQERTAELDRSEQRFRSLVQNSSDVITVVDGRRNDHLPEPVDRARARPRQRRPSRHVLLRPRPSRRPRRPHRRSSTRRRTRQGTNVAAELRIRSGDGVWCHAEVLGTSLLDDAHVAGIVLNARDVTERKELENQLAHQAFHDPLTNLANRALFADRLDHALQAGGPPAPTARRAVLRPRRVQGDQRHPRPRRRRPRSSRRSRRACRPACAPGTRSAGGAGTSSASCSRSWRPTPRRTPPPSASSTRCATRSGSPSTEVFISASIGIVVSELGAEACDDLLRYADLAMYRAKVEPPGLVLPVRAGDAGRRQGPRRARPRPPPGASSATSCSSPTSRSSISPPVGSSASRRWRAGRTRPAVRSRRWSSSRPPRPTA